MQLNFSDSRLTQEGYFKGRAIVTGVAVLDYTGIYGVHMLRPEDEVWKPASIESAKGIPLTLRHPSGLLTGENATDHAIGSTGDLIERIGNSLAINFTIIDGDIAKEVWRRSQEKIPVQFSMGYWAIPDATPGTYNGTAYQVIQRAIFYNHLALLLDEDGRYPYTELITDSNSSKRWLLLLDGQLFEVEKNAQEALITVKKTLPNGQIIEVADNDAAVFDTHITDYNHLKNQLDEKSGSLKVAEKQLEAAKGQILDAKGVNAAAAKQLERVMEAKPYLDDHDIKDLIAMSPRQLQESVLLTDESNTADELKTESDQVISGMYRQFVKSNPISGSEIDAEEILDSAQNISRKRAKDGAVIVIKDAFAEAQTAMNGRMAETFKNSHKGA